MPFTLVLLLPVRSALPPTISGTAGTRASSAFWLLARVASLGLASACCARSAASGSCQASGRRPAMARSNSACCGWRARRFSQLRRVPAPRRPATSQGSLIPAGISKGANSHPIAALAPAASVLPSGLPCTPPVPALLGAAKPMMVLQAISVGFLLRVAQAMAAATSAGSCPFTRRVAQP